MEPFSQLLKQSADSMVTVGQGNEDHVIIVTSSVGVNWIRFSTQFAVDANILRPDYQRPCGYILRSDDKWFCHIWRGGTLIYCFQAASDKEFERDAEFIPPSILLVDMGDIDVVVETLMRAGHTQVSGIDTEQEICAR